VSEGAHTCAWPLFHCRDLDINPTILKLKGDIDILRMYLRTKNEVARLRHLKLLTVDEICMANKKNMKIVLKIKNQGQTSPTSNHRQTHKCYQKQYLLAACVQVKSPTIMLKRQQIPRNSSFIENIHQHCNCTVDVGQRQIV